MSVLALASDSWYSSERAPYELSDNTNKCIISVLYIVDINKKSKKWLSVIKVHMYA